MGSLPLLQGIFPTQGSNPCLPHCKWILYQLSYKGSPRIMKWVAYSFSRGSSQPRNWTGVSHMAGGFFTNWAIREDSRLNWLWLNWFNSGCTDCDFEINNFPHLREFNWTEFWNYECFNLIWKLGLLEQEVFTPSCLHKNTACHGQQVTHCCKGRFSPKNVYIFNWAIGFCKMTQICMVFSQVLNFKNGKKSVLCANRPRGVPLHCHFSF